MSWTLIRLPEGTALAATVSVVKAADVRAVEGAVAMLAEAERMLADARSQVDAWREAARREGREAALAEVRAEMADSLAAVAARASAEGRRRDEELAEAAYAAVEAMLGAAGVEAVGPALLRHALASFTGDAAVTVEVAPALVASLGRALADEPDVTVIANPALGALDCRLHQGAATIDVGLPTQMAALAERWGVERAA